MFPWLPTDKFTLKKCFWGKICDKFTLKKYFHVGEKKFKQIHVKKKCFQWGEKL